MSDNTDHADWEIMKDDFEFIRHCHDEAEVRALAERAFTAIDKDNSGTLSKAEITAVHDHMQAELTAHTGANKTYSKRKTWDMFLNYDHNKDGCLTKEEFLEQFVFKFKTHA